MISNLRDLVALLGGECWNIPVRRTLYNCWFVNEVRVRVIGFGLDRSTVFFRFCVSYLLTPGVVKKGSGMYPQYRKIGKNECVWSEHAVRYVI